MGYGRDGVIEKQEVAFFPILGCLRERRQIIREHDNEVARLGLTGNTTPWTEIIPSARGLRYPKNTVLRSRLTRGAFNSNTSLIKVF